MVMETMVVAVTEDMAMVNMVSTANMAMETNKLSNIE